MPSPRPRSVFVERHRLRAIMALALPIVGGMVSQNILNLVDTLMVSRLGPAALAGVGLGGFVNFLAIAFITGLSTGVQAIAARRKGQGREGEMAVPLNGGLLLVAVIAVPLSVILILATPYFFPLLVDDPAVAAVGIPYVQVRIGGALAVGCNFAFRGYWNGVSRPGLYMRTLVIMHACNVAISYLLIFGALGAPELGATGAAVGTTASTYIGTAYYIYLGRRHAGDAGFLGGLPSRQTLRDIFRLSVPSGIQSMFFAAGLTALFVIIGQVGSAELAAATVLINLTLVAILPGLGLGLASASLVGQALGRGDVDDAERWGWDVVRVAAAIMFVLGLPMLLFPEHLLGLFFDAGDEVPLILATGPLMLVGATIAIDAAGMVLLNSLMGAGATRAAMIVSVIAQWGLFLPAAVIIGPVLGFGLLGIWLANIAYRMILAAILVGLWRGRDWAKVKV